MKIRLLCLFVLSASICVGCASEYLPDPPPAGDAASTKLAEAADSVNDSLETLAGIRKAEMPRYKKTLPNYSFGLYNIISVDWTGPIGPLLKKLAKISGFKYRQLGNPPAIPVIVAIHKQDTRIGTVVRDADYQAGEKADVVVYPSSRIIELRYKHLTS